MGLFLIVFSLRKTYAEEMRRVCFIVVVLCLLPSCRKDVPFFFGSRTRSDMLQGTFTGAERGAHSAVPEFHKDTLLYACGVEWPEGYDWNRDSCAGSQRGNLVLMCWMKGRDGKDQFVRLKDIPASPSDKVSTDTDMHHLLGGHLYTEYSDDRRTSFGCDGELRFTIDGRYFLKGICEDEDGSLLTLWQSRSGAGVRLFRGGNCIFSRDGAMVFGGMDGPEYGRTGALHMGAGGISFAFTLPSTDGTIFVWQQGEEMMLTVSDRFTKVLDVRVAGGRPLVLGSDGRRLLLSDSGKLREVSFLAFEEIEEAYILEVGGKAAVCSRGTEMASMTGLYLDCDDGKRWYETMDTGGLLLQDGENLLVMGYNKYSEIWIQFDGWRNDPPYLTYYFFKYPGAAAVCGKKAALAMTERYRKESKVWLASGNLDVPLRNGCLTGAEYVIKER